MNNTLTPTQELGLAELSKQYRRHVTDAINACKPLESDGAAVEVAVTSFEAGFRNACYFLNSLNNQKTQT
jgi:hypothetical protein